MIVGVILWKQLHGKITIEKRSNERDWWCCCWGLVFSSSEILSNSSIRSWLGHILLKWLQRTYKLEWQAAQHIVMSVFHPCRSPNHMVGLLVFRACITLVGELAKTFFLAVPFPSAVTFHSFPFNNTPKVAVEQLWKKSIMYTRSL